MTSTKRTFLLLALAIFCIASFPGTAQSSYTKSGLNGALFDAHTAFNMDDIVQSFGGQLGYSIGGILDVGLNFSMAYDEIEGQASQETNIGMKYGIMLLKQEDLSPVSLELSGSYGYSFVESDYYTDADPERQKEGRGYQLKLHLLHDFATGNSSAIRLGPFAALRSYRYTVEAISLGAEEDQEFLSERETGLFYGIELAFHKTSAQGKTYYLSLEPSMDDNLNFSAALRTGLVYEIR
jgi:hypothetical protein